jgi:hypothetical protein
MDLATLMTLLEQIKGCTFATIDSVTEPTKGIRCETSGTRVILFTNKTGSGYERMVRRRLKEAGKNPDDFVLSHLPWGERVPETPLIAHRGEIYLQTIVLTEGTSRCFLRDTEVNCSDFLPRRNRPNQGLGADSVLVRTYNLNSIIRIALMGEVLVADAETASVMPLQQPERPL